MKIILFADRLPPQIGGMETHAHYFVQYFKQNYNLTIVSRRDGKDILVDTEYRYLKNIELSEFLISFRNEKTVLFFNSGRWIDYLRTIRKTLPDSIMIYRTGGNEIIQSPLPFEMADYQARREYWKNAINDTVDHLITNSNFTDKRLIDFGINQEILRHIAGGIDPETVRAAVRNKALTRDAYHIEMNTSLCVSCARLVPYKRVDFLIRAIAKCKKPITLLLAGDGSLEEEIKELAQYAGYPIRFLGNLPQKDSVSLIAAADVYVQASTDLEKKVPGGSYIHTEGMGRSLLEAVCCGIPVVVTGCGAVGEYIGEGNGALVSSEEEMATVVDRFLTEKQDFTENIENNIEKYSFERIFEEYKRLWQ